MSILAGDGSITESLLKLIGGEIRPLNYQRVSDAPWRTPSNDSEELVYRGLLLARSDTETVYYQIADELIPALSAELLKIERDNYEPNAQSNLPYEAAKAFQGAATP